MFSGHVEDRGHLDSWCRHIEDELGQPFVFAPAGVGPGKQVSVRRVMSLARPGFASVDNPAAIGLAGDSAYRS